MLARNFLIFLLTSLLLGACAAPGKPPVSSHESDELPEHIQDLLSKAEIGDAYAQFELGQMYMDGKEVQKDRKKGLGFIEQAASQGIPDAYGHLGMAYYTGKGLRRRGIPDAYGHLAMAYSGKGISRNEKLSMVYFTMAAELGEPGWLLNLGLAYHEGRGVPVDKARSYAYFYLASLAGNTQMYHQPDILARDMPIEQLLEGMKIAREWWKEHCYNATWSENCADNMETRIHLDRKHRFNIIPPEKWRILNEIGKGQAVMFMGKASLGGGSFSPPKIYVRAEEILEETIISYSADAQENVARLYDDFNFLSNHMESINNYEAHLASFKVNTEIIELRGLQAGIQCGSIHYTLTAVCPKSKWDENEDIFLKSFNTFNCFL